MVIFGLGFVFIAAFFFLLIVATKATYQVSQNERIIIERFGKFHALLDSGIHFVIPFIDSPCTVNWTFIKYEPNSRRYHQYTQSLYRIDLRETVYDFPKQNVITKDNVTMEINALLYFQITDPKRAVYEINNLPQAIEKLTQTTLRDVIGALDLDESLISRETINNKLRIRLDEATDKWGVKVNRVELQEINPPEDIRLAMEKQMKAERDRRAHILEAEGLKTAEILKAEGYKTSLIERAEGDAQAKLRLAQAEADSIMIIKASLPNSDPAHYMIANSYIKALPEIMKDKHGKVILVPYEAAAMSGAVTGLKEILSGAQVKS